MGLTTYLCEKPSQALALSKILGLSQNDKQLTHYFNKKKGICILPARGHLFELAPPEFYNADFKKGWKLSNLPVIPSSLSSFQVDLKEEFKKLFSDMKKRLSETDLLFVCTDPDDEGELIGTEIIKMANYSGEQKRILCSSTLEADLKKALLNPQDMSKTASLAVAADLRRKLDWLIGMNGTMSATTKLKALNKIKRKQVFNIGRVITALALIIHDREVQIEKFKPTKFYKIVANLRCDGVEFDAELELPASILNKDGYLTSRATSEGIIKALPKKVFVQSVEEKEESKSAPLPFDLGSLQIEAGKLKIDPERTLQIIQALYDQPKSALTYPRTDCRYLPEQMKNDVNKVLDHLNKSIPMLATMKVNLDLNQRCFNDEKVTAAAHHGIVPTTKYLDFKSITDQEKAIYILVAKRFFQQFMEKYRYKKTSLLVGTEKFKFKASGNQVLELGWKALEPSKSKDSNLPLLSDQSDIELLGYSLKEGVTKPPKRFTKAELIQVMERPHNFVRNEKYIELVESSNGIGTPATRSDVIKRATSSGLIDASKSTVRPGNLISKYADRLQLFSVEHSVLLQEKLRQASNGEFNPDELYKVFSNQTLRQVEQWQKTSS